MVVTSVIEFDQNPHGTYFAGQVVTGKVTLQTNKVQQVRGIVLKITGKARTSWSENNTSSTIDAHGHTRTETHTTWYSGNEDYMASITNLLGSNEGGSVKIEPGVHTFNFACHIPIICPSSFEGTFGYVRYTIKVAIQRPYKTNQSFTRGITVLKLMDLNYDSPKLSVPANSEAYKTFCCGPCESDPLKIGVSIPQTGYVPGQTIPVSVLITNDSNVEVQSIKVSLAMLVRYHSQSPCKETKQERITVTKLKSLGVTRYCTKSYEYDLPVPATPPTCFNLCRIIQIAYQVEVEAEVVGMHTNQVVSIPVTIGNVPLMKVIQHQPISNAGMQRELLNAATLDSSANALDGNLQQSVDLHTVARNNEDINAIEILSSEQSEATASCTPWSADPNIPPPSYEEAVHMKRANIIENDAHDKGPHDFAPRYPVFSIPGPIGSNNNESEVGNVNKSNNNNDPDKSTWL